MTYDLRGESDSGSDVGGLVIRERREGLNMPRVSVGAIREQIEANRDSPKKF